VVFDRARVIELCDAGQSWREMAAALAVSVRAVRRVYEGGVAKPAAEKTGTSDAVKRVAGA
jgi:hypothetical protein